MRKLVLFAGLCVLGGSLSFGGVPAGSASGFAPAADYVAGDGPVSVAIGDLNGDGNPDLATANLYGARFSVLLSRGDGTFGPKRDYRTGGDPRSIAMRDLNGDGKPDVVTVSSDGERRFGAAEPGRRRLSSAGRDYQASGLGRTWDRRLERRRRAGRSDRESLFDGLCAPEQRQRPLASCPSIPDRSRAGVGRSRRSEQRRETRPRDGELGGGHRLCARQQGQRQVRTTAGSRGRPWPDGRRHVDVSGDGRPDIVSANLDSGTVSVLVNGGNGTFTAHDDYPVEATLGRWRSVTSTASAGRTSSPRTPRRARFGARRQR